MNWISKEEHLHLTNLALLGGVNTWEKIQQLFKERCERQPTCLEQELVLALCLMDPSLPNYSSGSDTHLHSKNKAYKVARDTATAIYRSTNGKIGLDISTMVFESHIYVFLSTTSPSDKLELVMILNDLQKGFHTTQEDPGTRYEGILHKSHSFPNGVLRVFRSDIDSQDIKHIKKNFSIISSAQLDLAVSNIRLTGKGKFTVKVVNCLGSESAVAMLCNKWKGREFFCDPSREEYLSLLSNSNRPVQLRFKMEESLSSYRLMLDLSEGQEKVLKKYAPKFADLTEQMMLEFVSVSQ